MQTQTQRPVEEIELSYDPNRNPKQVSFHKADATYILYGGAMGGGKTAAIINEGLQLSLDYPGNDGLLIRKTWPSLRDTVLPQMEKFIPDELVDDWNRSEKIITLVNGSKIRYGGIGEKPNDWKKKMSGEYGWIAIDQAEEFTEHEFRMLSTRLRLVLPGIKYKFLLTCNPDPGWIKSLFVEAPGEDRLFIPALPEDNIENLPKDYLKRMKDSLTPKQQRALLDGDWEAIGDPDNVFPYSEVKKAVERNLEPTPPIELGVDVARHGDDITSITLREGLKVRIKHRAKGHDLMRTAGETWRLVDEAARKWKDKISIISVKVDTIGQGSGVYDRLNEEKSKWQKKLRIKIKLVDINGARRARDPIKFKNLRSEIHWGLRELLPYLDLPQDSELISQLNSIKYKINSAGQIRIAPKDEIKKKLGRSPDDAESVIYSLAQTGEEEEEGSVYFGRTDEEEEKPKKNDAQKLKAIREHLDKQRQPPEDEKEKEEESKATEENEDAEYEDYEDDEGEVFFE